MKNVEEKFWIKLMENKTSMKKCHLWNMAFFIGLLYSIFVFLYCKAVEERREMYKA